MTEQGYYLGDDPIVYAYVIPQYAFGLRPAWGVSFLETGIDIEAYWGRDRGFLSIEPYLKLRWLERTRYRSALVIAFPLIIPRMYLLGDYQLNETFTLYSSVFFDHRGGSLYDGFLDEPWDPRGLDSIGCGALVGIDINYASMQFPVELGIGSYREPGPRHTITHGIHPFVGVGIVWNP